MNLKTSILFCVENWDITLFHSVWVMPETRSVTIIEL